jgi:hypothetical protein
MNGVRAASLGAAAEKKTDAEMIRGVWKVVSAKQTAGFEDNIDVTEYLGSVWTFSEKEITIKKSKAQMKLAYALDPKKKRRPCPSLEVALVWRK